MAGENVGGDSATSGGEFASRVGALFNGATVIDPSTVGGPSPGSGSEAPGDGTPRGRGRPKGSKTRSSSKAQDKASLDLDGVEKLLLAIHAGIASILQVPEAELDNSEAKKLAEAFARVSRHYPILDTIGDKAIDHANLFATVGGVYGTRFFAWNIRRTAEKARPVSPKVVTPDFHSNGRP